MADPVFKTLAIVGIGLIGSSIARVVRKNGLAGKLIAIDADSNVLAEAKELGLADVYANLDDAMIGDADAIILAVPVGAIASVSKVIASRLKSGALVTDTGSVKAAVLTAFAETLPIDVHAIPGHPIAGTEQSGPNAGFAGLFQDRWVILTPPQGADQTAVSTLRRFWEGCGSPVDIMDAGHHDRVLAITSHLPHLIAYNIVGTVAELEDDTKSEVIKYSASGFRDFTRIAASDPTMWRDVFLANREAVLEMLGRFTEDLTALQRAIRRSDGDKLFELFSSTRDIRRGIIDAGQETEEPDFGRRHSDASL